MVRLLAWIFGIRKVLENEDYLGSDENGWHAP